MCHPVAPDVPVPTLSPHEARLLQLFGVLPRLTTPQVTRAFYAASSEKHVGKLLAELERRGFLLHGFTDGRGMPNAAYIYAPALAGRRYLMAAGFTFAKSFKRKHETALGADYTGHSLGIADLAITAVVAARTDPRIAVGRIAHDEYLRPTTAGKLPVSPDLFVAMHMEGKPAPFAVEYDRSGKEGEEVWRKKVRDYIRGDARPYLDFFDVASMEILTIVDPPREALVSATIAAEDAGARRRERAWRRMGQLMAWTRAELCELRRESWASLFWFTIERPADLYGDAAVAYFTAAHWYRPGEAAPRAFLAA